ncbi:MAG: transposase [Elusimicrobia bacterium]|nr:transposase [Elusimicrobiota bacterium]
MEQLNISLDSIQDEKIKETIHGLFNLIEDQAATIRQQQEEIQRLRDENNRLKGEQGKPPIKPGTKKNNQDISSEKERKQNNHQGQKGSKKDAIEIDRTQICEVDKEKLPPDAEFKGYDIVVVQDLKIGTDHVAFAKEIYYSPSENKTYRGSLPAGYQGGFGPTVKALALVMKNVCNTSEPKILEFFGNFNVQISSGTLSNILIKDKETFHQEKKDLFEAGLEAASYQQIDDTSARVNGQNHHTHVICSPLYTAYFTAKKKDRLTILEILKNGRALTYRLNQEALELLTHLRVAQKHVKALETFRSSQEYSKEQMIQLLNGHSALSNDRLLTKILEASAIASYHQGIGYPVVKVMVADDAPQFKLLTEELALCWVHDGRHYKKLTPVVPCYLKELDDFLARYWDYYRRLLSYKEAPSEAFAAQLADEFDKLFSTQTGYRALAERILKTREKKDHLLLVLKYPQLPLHNNASELAARAQTRKRDVSLHTITKEGTQANDTFLTIAQTCKKLGINTYEYIFDRIRQSFNIPSLAQLIREKALRYQGFPLGP